MMGMGHRVLKRVPLDFRWPPGKVWRGYVNPHPGPRECDLCDGSGYNAATNKIAKEFYDFDGDGSRKWCDNITQDEVQALVDASRLLHFTHVWEEGEGWRPKKWDSHGYWCPVCHVAVPQLSPEHHSAFCTGCKMEMLLLPGDDARLHVPTADEVNKRNRKRHGHDVINRWILIEARAKRLGVFGTCSRCKGKGSKFPAHVPHRPYNAWREYEPPTGTGYQLWETCSEGSPNSPVFSSAEELAEWCATGATIFAGEKTSMENWLKMFVGEGGLGAGSMLVGRPGFFGAKANAPK